MAHAPLVPGGLHLAIRTASQMWDSAETGPAGQPTVQPAGEPARPNVDVWALGVLEFLGVASDARGTSGAPLGIPLDSRPTASQTGKASFGPGHPEARPGASPRDGPKRRDAGLKAKQGSRQRRRWENDRLMHVPNVQPPLPSDWEVRPTHPVHYGIPYHLAQYWDKGLRQQANETRAAAAVLRRQQIVARQAGTNVLPNSEATSAAADVRVGTVTRELRAAAKKTPAVKTWMRVLEEPVRSFIQAAEAHRAAGGRLDGQPEGHHDTDAEWTSGGEDTSFYSDEDDEDDEEIVFIGRSKAALSQRPRQSVAEQKQARHETKQQVDAGIVFDELGDDRDGSFKRWLTHSISDYYGLASHSVTVDNPARRIVYVTIRDEVRQQNPPLIVPRPMWELF